ncbi:glycosyltransferase 10 family protein [Synechococcus sp. RS9907]|uniref:glycosyltransferase family 10 domain-containing protein n=1 Tax=Synechococcus sp. RS9907 TaxID=221350 RepID=UPI00165E064A|nr:glycosyltransferase family 10 [Synechococcus sp. RS9907]QNI83315.1 glycosyltransferase 10 family protein [Synechococcus sp. RS9907]
MPSIAFCSGLNSDLFEGRFGDIFYSESSSSYPSEYWRYPLRLLAQRLILSGWTIQPNSPDSEFDVLYLRDLPKDPVALAALAKRSKTLVVHLAESPLRSVSGIKLLEQLRQYASLVISYMPMPQGIGIPWLTVPLPFLTPPVSPLVHPNALQHFDRRRHLCMISGCDRFGWRRRLSEPLLFYSGSRQKNPVKMPRYVLADSIARVAPDSFDIYGYSWNFARSASKKCWRRSSAQKNDILTSYKFYFAFENFKGSIGYITEKIFDGFRSGCIPIYAGDLSIDDHIPSDAYIDARQFSNIREILDFLQTFNSDKWSAMSLAGVEFMKTQFESSPFSPQIFVEKVASFILCNALKDDHC